MDIASTLVCGVVKLDWQGYAPNGRYFGCNPIAVRVFEVQAINSGFHVYVRAKSRRAAIAQVVADLTAASTRT